MLKKTIFKLLALCILTSANAAEPTGYYTSCEGKSGKALLSALNSKISNHHNVGYDGLWAVYKTSDVRADGTLWDIYSTKHWPSNFTKCGNYKVVGDCVNREHSLPKSWWGKGSSAQYSDAYHLYPTDGKVNGQRSNFPFGECSGGKRLPNNGSVQALGRLGSCTYPGYSGQVFEPDDEYKGDLARTYFYMVACYNSIISGWTQDNGSQFFAGNSYPAFKEWSRKMMLEWNAKDPVSQKEIDRNEAIYKHQNNRNPFIDHPELAEYIWGDKTDVPWTLSAGLGAQFVLPANNTTLDLGVASVGVTRSTTVSVKGSNLKEAVSVSVSGAGFSVTPRTLTASAVNGAGATLTVSYSASAAVSSATGTLTLTSGDAQVKVNLKAKAVDGLPAGPATGITESSFVATWSCIDDGSVDYTIDVRRNGASISGFPTEVSGGAEQMLVSGLEPETTYTYQVSAGSISSDWVSVTTAAPTPSVSFLYDGELSFATAPGVPSEVAEVLVDVENIPGEILISVTAPFEVSTDKASWSTVCSLAPGEDRFYMRLYGQTEGDYSTSLTATADGYENDDTEVTGTIATDGKVTFYEDFEPDATGGGSYGNKTYAGTACKWTTDGLFEKNGSNSFPHTGEQAVRMNKTTNGYLYMAEDKTKGIGTVSFWCRQWKTDKSDVKIQLLVSEDHGSTWKEVQTFDIPHNNGASNVHAEYVAKVSNPKANRIKLVQTQGTRAMIDDVSITDCLTTGGVNEANMADYHRWDAYCRGGQLVIEADEAVSATVYSTDGIEHFNGTAAAGSTPLRLAPGLYIVVVDDFSRRVVVK